MSPHHPLRILAVLLCAASMFSQLWAQTVTGTIVGTVTDITGAVLPGVTVTVTNVSTAVEYTAIANEAGQYVVPFLSPGLYTVSAELPGFRTSIVSDVIVEVQRRIRADIVLQVGEISDVVQVLGRTSLISTEETSVGAVLDNKSVQELPLQGRQFLELAFLVPGVHSSAPGHFNQILQGVAMTGAGGRPTNNNFQLDGVDNTSINCGYFAVSPSVDSVQEFKISTSNYSAEFGRTGGAVINVATKRGTNNFHGSLFHFIRNDVFDARNFFNTIDRTGDGRADAEQLRRNQFGGSIGGPVILPGYDGRNRTFFFYNQEHMIQRKAQTRVGRVPSGPMLQGDFSGAGFTIYDPLTTRVNPDFDGTQPISPTNPQFIRDPFPGNRIPADRISPVATRVLSFYPAPNNPADPLRNFVNNAAEKKDDTLITARLDQRISDRDEVFGRVSISNVSLLEPGTIPPMFDTDLSFRGRNVALNWVRTISPTLVNEARLGYNRLNFGRLNPRQGTDFSSELGISGVPGSGLSGFPLFSIAGFNGLGDSEPYGNIDNIVQAINTTSYIRGNHNIKFGFDIRRILNDYFIARAPSGSYSLAGWFTGVPGFQAPEGVADLLLGLPTSTFLNVVGDIGRTRTTNFNTFIQNDWKASKSLTVNLGLRYELFTPPIDKFSRMGTVDFATGDLLFSKDAPLNDPLPGAGITEEDLPVPFRRLDRNAIMKWDSNNFAPRIGLAYKIAGTERTVLRAGYGISYAYLPFSDITVNSQRMIPFSVGVSRGFDVVFPEISNFDMDVAGAKGALQTGLFALAGFDPNFQWADVQQWSLNIQHEWEAGILVDIGYVGNKASHLAERWLMDAPLTPGPGSVQSRRRFPDRYASVTQVQSAVNNSYNALMARFEKRFSRGYGFLASYTWSKSIGQGSETYGTPGQESAMQDPFNRAIEKGLAPDDVRQRLAFSYLAELPFGQGRRFMTNAPKAVDLLFGGWQLNGIVSVQTGFHTTAIGGAFTNMGTGRRPDQIGDPNAGKFSVDRAFNVDAFALPEPFQFGTAPRGSIETPNLRLWDFSLMKNTMIAERVTLQIRAEAFNVLNRANFGLPNRNFDSPSFGRVSTAQDPRLIQFGFKLLF